MRSSSQLSSLNDPSSVLAINIGVKILGPVFGFVLGSLCTSLYVDPMVDPDVTPKDPRWIGAWWLGILINRSISFLE